MPIRRRLPAWFASLLVLLPLAASPPLRASEELVVQFDGLQIPIDLAELEAWSRRPEQAVGDQATWLNLLEPQSREGLRQLLRAPLLRDRSFGRELLNSWTGEQLLREVGRLLQAGEGQSSAPLLLATLQQLFDRQREVSSLDLLRALPERRLVLRIDGLLSLASSVRDELRHQAAAIEALRRQPLPQRHSGALLRSPQLRPSIRRQQLLPVAHRPSPLPLELWLPPSPRPGLPWLVMMPGLGGSSSQLSWLAQALAQRGWPVLVVEHPGSDAEALRASLQGDGPPPGAESVPLRLADLQAVLVAQREGRLEGLDAATVQAGDGVVLVGHSLGGLAALMAAGLVPEAGLAERCDRALTALPLTNLSRLLQCQLPTIRADPPAGSGPEPLLSAPQLEGMPLRAVVSFNGFGSLLWPSQGLAPLPVPVLMVGGSLDLITPPLQEQLALLASSPHPGSRLVLVDGASHFSPVRLPAGERALFQLGEELVGEEPERVQSLLLQLMVEFLESAQHPSLLSSQRRDHGGVRAYVLDGAALQRWRAALPAPPRPWTPADSPRPSAASGPALRSAPVGRAAPPAGPP